MKKPSKRVWKGIGVAVAVVVLYSALQIGSYATARPEVYEFSQDGNRWRYTHTKSLKILPLREWGFGTIIACGNTGGSTSRKFGFVELTDESWNTLLSGSKAKGRTPAW